MDTNCAALGIDAKEMKTPEMNTNGKRTNV